MFELIADVEALVQDELERANKKFPLFRSRHEGVAVIEEEVYETSNELSLLVDQFNELKRCVFEDEVASAVDIYRYASNLACEAIQVAAMAEKFEMSEEEEK